VVAGAIVDGGKFEWSKSDKFPGLTTPDESYHGVNYTAALGDGIAYIIKARVQLLRDLGSAIAPTSAWQLLQGIETLSLRIDSQVENAKKVAEFLSKHPQVESVNYAALPTSPWYEAAKKYTPKGPGAIVSFEIKGGVEKGSKFVESLNLFLHVANIGDVRSLVIHPASTTHSQLSSEQQVSAGVTPGLVRLSVGLESIEDIIADLETGFEAAK
jgi:O-acetylhomoserine (thiol)-lyase